ncbi:MAG TPA: sporulation protein YqfC [Bacilli bacterium]
MRRLRRQLSKWAGSMLDLPKDVIYDLPRITMIGNMQTYIENHRGVVRFSDQELELLLSKGKLAIRGSGLVMRAILPEEVFVEGRIDEVKYLDT